MAKFWQRNRAESANGDVQDLSAVSTTPHDVGHQWDSVDLTQQRVCLADDVLVWPARQQGETVFRLEIPQLHRFYQVGHSEYVFLSLLDGETTLAAACGLAAAELGPDAMTADQSESIVRWLLMEKLAYLPENGTPSRTSISRGDGASQNEVTGIKRILHRFNPFWIKLPLLRRLGPLEPVLRSMTWVMSPIAMILGCILLFIATLVVLTSDRSIFLDTASLIAPGNWIWLALVWVSLKIVHEFAHAIACYRLGGSVREIGLVFVLFAPLAYVDVSSCWRIPNRGKRMLISAAGMWSEFLIAAIAVIWLSQTDSAQLRSVLQNVIFMAGVSTILFNANVLMRFDGYYLLADWVQIPNLYAVSQSQWKGLVQRHVFAIPTRDARLTGWRWWFCLVYGLAAMIWKVAVCGTLLIAASALFSGGGIVLVVLGLALWVGGPLVQFLRFSSEQLRFDRLRYWRGAAILSMLGLVVIATVAWMPLPTSIRLPGVVQYPRDAMVRSGADGFLRVLHVRHGQTVRQGDLLFEIENRRLVSESESLQLQLEKNRWLSRKARDEHDASELQVLNAESESISRQLADLESKVHALRRVAHRDGTVIARGLRNRVGTFVREGDALLNIATPGDYEVAALVHQDDIRWVRDRLGQSTRIVDRADLAHSGKLEWIAPRASLRLTHPSLSASENGPLTVERPHTGARDEEDDEPMRLTEPYFAARVGLDPNQEHALTVGMRTTVHVGYRTDSIEQRIGIAVRRLWYRRFKL